MSATAPRICTVFGVIVALLNSNRKCYCIYIFGKWTWTTTKVNVFLKLPTHLAKFAAAQFLVRWRCRHTGMRSTVLATCVAILTVLLKLEVTQNMIHVLQGICGGALGTGQWLQPNLLAEWHWSQHPLQWWAAECRRSDGLQWFFWVEQTASNHRGTGQGCTQGVAGLQHGSPSGNPPPSWPYGRVHCHAEDTSFLLSTAEGIVSSLPHATGTWLGGTEIDPHHALEAPSGGRPCQTRQKMQSTCTSGWIVLVRLWLVLGQLHEATVLLTVWILVATPKTRIHHLWWCGGDCLISGCVAVTGVQGSVDGIVGRWWASGGSTLRSFWSCPSISAMLCVHNHSTNQLQLPLCMLLSFCLLAQGHALDPTWLQSASWLHHSMVCLSGTHLDPRWTLTPICWFAIWTVSEHHELDSNACEFHSWTIPNAHKNGFLHVDPLCHEPCLHSLRKTINQSKCSVQKVRKACLSMRAVQCSLPCMKPHSCPQWTGEMEKKKQGKLDIPDPTHREMYEPRKSAVLLDASATVKSSELFLCALEFSPALWELEGLGVLLGDLDFDRERDLDLDLDRTIRVMTVCILCTFFFPALLLALPLTGLSVLADLLREREFLLTVPRSSTASTIFLFLQTFRSCYGCTSVVTRLLPQYSPFSALRNACWKFSQRL